MGWGVTYYKKLTEVMAYISGRILRLDEDLEAPNDHIDTLGFGRFPRKHKYKVVLRELRRRLTEHGAMMDEWHEKISWLWDWCQPQGNQAYQLEWDEMMGNIRRGNPVEPAVFDGVDEVQEETVLEVDLDDGEDAEAGLIAEMETHHIDERSEGRADDTDNPKDN
ncbi:hypothetical protein PCASD_06691 [Puccinia coronata f. sp. avenae]|uniref:Uncharacterized protein n=1 Tax=Puccinia coronata f. sp. avenae TaxID=200324 RepID=A0A2N5TF51_9BASI|nr:hypothetical protein PCASD_06691 [Puccinia coronata f. sp. avenae]